MERDGTVLNRLGLCPSLSKPCDTGLIKAGLGFPRSSASGPRADQPMPTIPKKRPPLGGLVGLVLAAIRTNSNFLRPVISLVDIRALVCAYKPEAL